MTRAPAFCALAEVASVEPLSTTMHSWMCAGSARTTAAMEPASLSAGMMTLMVSGIGTLAGEEAAPVAAHEHAHDGGGEDSAVDPLVEEEHLGAGVGPLGGEAVEDGTDVDNRSG